MATTVDVDVDSAGVALITLDGPERLNALSPAMTAGLTEALERLAGDHGVGAIVIAGAGRSEERRVGKECRL